MTTLADLSSEVILRARQADAGALTAIVDALQKPFYNLALRMLLDPTDAEDATQEALLKVLTRLDSFEEQSRFSTWAWTVASRSILDFRRGRSRRATLSFDAFQADLMEGLVDDAQERPEDRVLLAQVKVGCARALLQCLDGDHRLAYVLGEVMQLSGADGAAIADVPPATFRKRLSRARKHISNALEQHCGIVEPTAKCRCHRRLERAKALGRASNDAPDPGIDVQELRSWIRDLEDVADRAAAYYRADPQVELSPTLRHELQRVARLASASRCDNNGPHD